MSERERLIKVTSEAQLKPGLLVAYRCLLCFEIHRLLLTRVDPDEGLCRQCNQLSGCQWRFAGPTPHQPNAAPRFCVVAAIAERRLFIVDTGLEDETPARTEKTRPKEVARG